MYNPRISYVGKKWIFTCCLECEKQAPKLRNYSLGIDLNAKKLAVVSYDFVKSKIYNNPNKLEEFKAIEERIKFYQRQRDNCYNVNGRTASSNKEKYRKTCKVKDLNEKIAWRYRKLSNKRKDFIHKMSREIINLLPRRIVLEDLNVQEMIKTFAGKGWHKAANSLSKACFYFIRWCLTYKAEELGIEVVLADQFYPSSQTCFFCGQVNADLKLHERVFKCPCCHSVIDRDLNAAKNLEFYQP